MFCVLKYIFKMFFFHFYWNRGVVAVSVDMLQMDINQCEDDYYVPNAFKGTHKCDKKTSYVSCNLCNLIIQFANDALLFIIYFMK